MEGLEYNQVSYKFPETEMGCKDILLLAQIGKRLAAGGMKRCGGALD